MSVYAELVSTGGFGTAGAELLYAVVGAVARGGQYPPPSRGRRWTKTDIADVAHDVMAGDGHDGSERVPFFAELRVHSVDDATLARHLHRMVQRHLADRGRQSPKGALIRRLRALLDDARFERRGGDGYTVAGGPRSATGDYHPDALRRAAETVHLTKRTFGPEARRRSPLVTDSCVVDVCQAVLRACPYPLPVDELADVVAGRIGLALDESEGSFDAARPPPEPVAPDAVGAAGARVDAEAVWDMLDPELQRTVAVLRLDAREAAVRLGVGKTKANAMQNGTLFAIARALSVADPPRDREGLRELLGRDDVRPVLLALDGLARERAQYDEPWGDEEGAEP